MASRGGGGRAAALPADRASGRPGLLLAAPLCRLAAFFWIGLVLAAFLALIADGAGAGELRPRPRPWPAPPAPSSDLRLAPILYPPAPAPTAPPPVRFHPDLRPRPRPARAAFLPVRPVPLALARVPVFFRWDLRPAPRPVLRPGGGGVGSIALAAPAPVKVVFLPEELKKVATRSAAAAPPLAAMTLAARPALRPGPLPAPAAFDPAERAVCGDPAIRGVPVPPLTGRLRGCGIARPVKVTRIDGLRLTAPATVNCATARALKRWIRGGVKPAVGRMGGGPVALRVIASYSCRTRNSRPGAKLSEHAKGNAVDVAAIILADGRAISVREDWGRGRKGRLLARLHRAACGPFGTVLGPRSDRYHRDHFHLDVARYRSGPYCR